MKIVKGTEVTILNSFKELNISLTTMLVILFILPLRQLLKIFILLSYTNGLGHPNFSSERAIAPYPSTLLRPPPPPPPVAENIYVFTHKTYHFVLIPILSGAQTFCSTFVLVYEASLCTHRSCTTLSITRNIEL